MRKKKYEYQYLAYLCKCCAFRRQGQIHPFVLVLISAFNIACPQRLFVFLCAASSHLVGDEVGDSAHSFLTILSGPQRNRLTVKTKTPECWRNETWWNKWLLNIGSCEGYFSSRVVFLRQCNVDRKAPVSIFCFCSSSCFFPSGRWAPLSRPHAASIDFPRSEKVKVLKMLVRSKQLPQDEFACASIVACRGPWIFQWMGIKSNTLLKWYLDRSSDKHNSLCVLLSRRPDTTVTWVSPLKWPRPSRSTQEKQQRTPAVRVYLIWKPK